MKGISAGGAKLSGEAVSAAEVGKEECGQEVEQWYESERKIEVAIRKLDE